jgi:hypothetical protein
MKDPFFNDLDEVMTMKALIRTTLIALALSVPALSFAQSQQAPLTRAEVRAQLAQIEQAGYNPAHNDNNYPADIQAAEAKVASEDHAAAVNAVGGVSLSGTSEAGAARMSSGNPTLFLHH